MRRRPLLQPPVFAALLAALLGLAPSPAWAAGGGGSGQSLSTVLLLIGIIAVAYIVTHLVVNWLERRFGFITGIEYLVLGIMAGPVLGWIGPGTFELLSPFLSLGIGAIGLWAGLTVPLRGLDALDRRALKAAVVTSGMTALVLLGVPWAGLALLSSGEADPELVHILLIGACVGLVSDPRPVQLLAAALQAKGEAPRFAARAGAFASAAAIGALGLILVRPASFAGLEQLEILPWHWVGIELGIGLLLGGVFATFLRRELDEEHLLAVLIGMIIFTSGAAVALGMSALFLNFVVGLFLKVASRHAERVQALLANNQKPFSILLFFFAGVAWSTPEAAWMLLLGLPWLVLRLAGRAAASPLLRMPGRPAPARALLAPGGVSVAILLDYRLASTTALAQAAYAALLVALLVSEILAWRLTRRWLLDAADVPTSRLQAQLDLEGA